MYLVKIVAHCNVFYVFRGLLVLKMIKNILGLYCKSLLLVSVLIVQVTFKFIRAYFFFLRNIAILIALSVYMLEKPCVWYTF